MAASVPIAARSFTRHHATNGADSMPLPRPNIQALNTAQVPAAANSTIVTASSMLPPTVAGPW